MYHRKIYNNRISKALNHDVIIFLIGPRQAGKTHIMRNLAGQDIISSNYVYLSLDNYIDKRIVSVEDFYQFILSYHNDTKLDTILLDEIQYFPNIGILLKGLFDYFRIHNIATKIICSGSGSLQIFTGISDSLVGRKEIIYVYPFSFEEFLEYKSIGGNKQSATVQERRLVAWEEFCLRGGYPAVIMAQSLEEKNRILDQIYQDYIMRDISNFLKREELVSFKHFFALLANNTCSLFGIETFARELGLSRTVIKRFLFILENTFIITLLQPFSTNKVKEISSRPKIYFIDTGFLRKVLSLSLFAGDMQGKAIETIVVNELLKYKSYQHHLYFWQKKSQTEIDIILQDTINYQLTAIEIKSGITDTFPLAFASFDELYHHQIDRFVLVNKSVYKKRTNNHGTIQFDCLPYTVVSELMA